MQPSLGLLFLLSLGHMAVDVNNGALPFLLPYFKEAFNLSYAATGAITLAANFSSSLIQPIFGIVSDRMQNYWLLPAGILLAGVGMAFTGYATSYWLLLAAVFVSGIGIAAYHPEGSKAAHFAGHGYSARFMAIFSVGGNLGFALGPVMALVLWQWRGLEGTVGLLLPTAVMTVLLSLILPAIRQAGGVATGQRPASANRMATASPQRQERQEKAAAGTAYGTLTLLTVIVILRSFIHSGLTNYIPLYYVSYLGGDPGGSGTLLTIFLLAGAAGTLLGSHIADRWGAKTLINISMVGLVPLTSLFLHAQGIWLLLLVAASGFLVVSTFATTIVLGQSYLPQNLGLASGIMMGFAIGAGGLGVTLLGLVADRWGVPVALQLIGLFPILGLVLTAFLPGQKRKGGEGAPSLSTTSK